MGKNSQIISYFDKVTKERYIANSITQLSLVLGVNRNAFTRMLEATQYYEDDKVFIFSIDNKTLIKGLPHNKKPTWKAKEKKKDTKEVKAEAIKPLVALNLPLVAQQPKEKTKVELWAEIRAEDEAKRLAEESKKRP